MFSQRRSRALQVIGLTLVVALLVTACGQKSGTSLDPATVVDIVGDNQRALLVTDAGELWATGLNDLGQLGVSQKDRRLVQATLVPPVDGNIPPSFKINLGYLPAPIKIATNVKQAAMSPQAGAYLTSDGELWVMGYESDLKYFPEVRQALANQAQGATRNDVVRPLKVMDEVKKIVAGGHLLILQENGDLFGAGSNYWGELGTGKILDSLVLIDQGVADVFMGTGNSFYLKHDGQLYSCGRNFWGELGFGEPTLKEYYVHSHEDPPHTARMNFPPQLIATDVQSVYSSGFITQLLKTDGELYMMGKNFENVYRDGSKYRGTPQLIASGVRKMGIATLEGVEQALLILNNAGQLLGWGSSLASLGVESDGEQWAEIASDVKDFWTTPNLFVLTNAGQMRAAGPKVHHYEEERIGQLAGWSWD